MAHSRKRMVAVMLGSAAYAFCLALNFVLVSPGAILPLRVHGGVLLVAALLLRLRARKAAKAMHNYKTGAP